MDAMITQTTQHTPGPWTIQELEHAYDGYENWNTYCIRSPQNVHIATVGNVDRFHEQDHEANARLLAAAPDLLAALQALKDWGCTHTSPRDPNSPHDLLIAAHEAIHKATGN
jgi:hypothetical protein